jgi:uncharacterized membrane protein
VTTAAEISKSRRTLWATIDALRERAWSVAIWTAMAGWSALLFVVARDAYATFRTGRFDLGNMVQAVWSTAHGHPLEVTHGTGEQITRLGSHVDPFLALLAPLWLIWPSPLALALAQIVVVALGALPVWWLGRRHLGSDHVAGVLALGYLAYPWVATSAVAAIHPVTFAITFYLFCVWFLDTNRLALFALFAALAMSTGELMGLPVLGLGIWYAIARGRRYEGAAIAATGLAWTTIAVFAIVPRFSGEDSMYFGFYDEVGGSPIGVIRTLFTDPGVVLGALVESHDIVYLVWLGLPLLFLFVLSPGLALVALPQLLANALSDFRSMTDPRYHSVAAVIPFLIAATVFGVARIRESRRSTAAAGILVSCVVVALAIGPWVRSVGLTPLGGRESVPAERAAALRDAVALVPRDAPVSASNTAAAHLSARRYVYSIPVVRRADWVVVDRVDPWIVTPDSPILTNHPEVVEAFLQRLEGDAAWRKVFDKSGVVVLRRTAVR